MTGAKPRVSVVIPAYNAEAYLGESIKSVLNQSWGEPEVIVVDDGSSDGTAAVAKRYPVTLLQQPNKGVSAAMNHGISVAGGEYLASNDADDIWLPHKLTRQFEALRAEPAPDMVFGLVEQFLSPEIAVEARRSRLREENRIMSGLTSQSLLIRADTFQRVGPFDESLRIGDFIEWYGRATHLKLRSHVIQEVLTRRRIHNSNTGVRERDRRGDYLKILKARLDRNRAGPS